LPLIAVTPDYFAVCVDVTQLFLHTLLLRFAACL